MINPNICLMCLRTERNLKTIDSELWAYHKEITNYCLLLNAPQYCSDCQYLLRKTYNFHKKCKSAANILNNWMNTGTSNKTPLNLLHEKLPPISLDTWKPENTKIFTYNYSDDLETPAVIDESISGKPDIITIEDNISEILDKNTIKERVTENTIGTISNTKLSGNTNFEINNVRTTQNLNDMTNQTNTISSCNMLTVPSQPPISYMVLLVNDDIEKNKRNENYKVNDTLKSINDMPILQLTQNMLIPSGNIANSPQLMHKLTNDIPTGTRQDMSFADRPKSTYDILKLTEDMSKNDSSKKSVSVNNPDDMDEEIICLDDENNKNDDVIVIDDEIEYPDDASLNSGDDCDDYLYPPRKERRPKMTLDELADVSLSDEEVDDNYVPDKCQTNNSSTKKYFSVAQLISLENTITSKLQTMNETLDSICQNWEITSLTDVGVPNVPNDEVNKFIRQYLTDGKVSGIINRGRSKYMKRTVETKLVNLSADLDLINGKCVQAVDEYKNGLCEPKQRVKADLLKKFESLGELRAPDGSVFDKDVVINSLDTAPERTLLRLLRLLKGFEHIMPGAARCLKTIIKKQQLVKYESVFNIEYMRTEKEMLEEFERRKTYERYVEAIYKCEICYQGFEYEGGLHYHKKSHDESKGPFSCRFCHVRFESQRTWSHHIKSHEVVYKCKLCPLVTHYSSSMINHYEQHQGTLYKCEPCGTTYKSRSVLLNHNTHSHSRPSIICTICGSTFISSLGLKYHIRRKHRDGKPDGSGEFICKSCDLTFYSQCAYNKHQQKRHNTKTTSIRRARRKPIMTCRVCNKVGHSYGWMVFHFRMEHPTMDVGSIYAHRRGFLCHVCGKGFSSKAILSRHIDYHNGVRFPCKTCGKSFPLENALIYHQITHGPRAICCDRCGKKFRSKSNLYNHMRGHIGDRRYKCNICGKGFLHRSSIKEHIQGVHNQVRRVKKRGVTKISRGVGDTPDGVTKTSRGVGDTPVGVKDTSRGLGGTPDGVTDTSVESGEHEDETMVYEEETVEYEEETVEYEEETVVHDEETVVYEDETGVNEVETGVSEDETEVYEEETVVYEDETELCEDKRGEHGSAEIGAEMILDTETGEMRLVRK